MMGAKHWVAIVAVVAIAITAIFAGPWALFPLAGAMVIAGLLG